jgi:hypothetical protein
MSDTVEWMAKAIKAKAWSIDLPLRDEECADLARTAIDAYEEAAWPELGPNSIFKPHTTTSVPIDKLYVDVILPEPDPKP